MTRPVIVRVSFVSDCSILRLRISCIFIMINIFFLIFSCICNVIILSCVFEVLCRCPVKICFYGSKICHMATLWYIFSRFMQWMLVVVQLSLFGLTPITLFKMTRWLVSIQMLIQLVKRVVYGNELEYVINSAVSRAIG